MALFWYFGVVLTGTVFLGCTAQLVYTLFFAQAAFNPSLLSSQAITLLATGAFTITGWRKARATRWARLREQAARKEPPARAP